MNDIGYKQKFSVDMPFNGLCIIDFLLIFAKDGCETCIKLYKRNGSSETISVSGLLDGFRFVKWLLVLYYVNHHCN